MNDGNSLRVSLLNMNNTLSFVGRPQTFTTSYNQQRASPYTINSPRTNRRQGMRFSYFLDLQKFFYIMQVICLVTT